MVLPETAYDTLTGLLNAEGSHAELTAALVEASAEMSGVVVICYVLQDSATISEHLGNEAMNSVLRMFGARLRGQIRDEDFVARLRDAQSSSWCSECRASFLQQTRYVVQQKSVPMSVRRC